MKTTLAILFTTASALVAAENIIPVAYTKDRYEETFGNSPFALETKVEVKDTTPKDGIEKNLELKGLGQADGKDYVIIQKVGEPNSMRFWGQEPTDGISIKEVHWSDKMGETYVIIRKGNEEGKVGFNELAMHGGAGAAGAPNPAPVNRGALPQRPPGGNFTGGTITPAPNGYAIGNAGARPPTPAFTPVRPTTNLPPRPTATPAPNGGFRSTPPGMPTPNSTPTAPSTGRQRIRVINNR